MNKKTTSKAQQKFTRFRAYQLGSAGSSFSYFDGQHITLIEARYTDVNRESIELELKACGRDRIDTLHITSWDQDHCSPKQLQQIIEYYHPSKIEYPGYEPHTDSGKESQKTILDFKRLPNGPKRLVQVTPAYIASLKMAERYSYEHILYHPKFIDPDSSNNNSTVKQFRTGSFNVLSLGDVESTHISAGLRRLRTINRETDIMIMAHHGADNGFTTSAFLKTTSPTIAIATANYDNQFEHPKPAIQRLLHKFDIRLFTTKTGDVVVCSLPPHTGKYQIINLKAGSTEISSQYTAWSKKSRFLAHNADSLRNRRLSRNRGPKRY
ncbi:MAG: hypothetical protein OXC41_09055 [Gammaproteobacteria bacterium]|nr:hypothetical protein [Gammaproteobacteria bacterium]